MRGFGRDGMVNAGQVADLTAYGMALSGRKADAAAVGRAQQLYADNCVACHTPTGVGDRTLGAPNLTDREWLFGSDRESIRAQIHNGRNGVMPTWEGRFSPAVIKALAVYVHVNAGGGEASSVAAAPAAPAEAVAPATPTEAGAPATP